MYAVWYEQVGPADQVLQFGDMEVPTLGPDEVRVRIHASGVNPSDLFLQVKDFKPLSRPFLQLLSQPDSCHVAQTHEAHGVATAVCGSKRLVDVRRICCYAPFATPSAGNAGT